MHSPPPPDAFLASLVNSSGDAILSQTLDGVVTSWNRGAERIFGHTAADMIGRPIDSIFPEDRLAEEAEILARVSRGETIERHETIRRRKDGKLVEISLTVSPIFGADGKIVGASRMARDISERRREEERLAVTLSCIGDAVISTDEAGRVIFMNTVAETLTGWPRGEALGRLLPEVFVIVNETTRLPVESPVDKVLTKGVTVGLANHTILVSRDGTEHPIDDSAAPIRDRTGRLIGVVLVFRDVAERRAAEISALRLAAIIEGSDDAIVSKDLNGIIRSWNPGAERIFGYTADEIVGRPVTTLIPLDRQNEERTILSRLQRGERVDHFQTLRVRKDGRVIHVSLTISPIRDDEGRIIGASKIARDITELKLVQEKLEMHAADLERKVLERTAKLEEMVGELESFSYSLSHDMRAPLRAIHSFSEIVLNDYGQQIPEGVDYLRRIIRAAHRMDRLINDLLSFARLSRGEIEMRTVDVDRLVHELIQERPEFLPPRAHITVSGPLPPVLGHEASVTQCLVNLLGNAVKFVAPGVVPMVEVFAERVADSVRICVRDNGIGISPEGQRRVFTIFQRLHPLERYEGTGVGLAIVRKAAERMGGSVGVASSEGLGSTFWVELLRA